MLRSYDYALSKAIYNSIPKGVFLNEVNIALVSLLLFKLYARNILPTLSKIFGKVIN